MIVQKILITSKIGGHYCDREAYLLQKAQQLFTVQGNRINAKRAGDLLEKIKR